MGVVEVDPLAVLLTIAAAASAAVARATTPVVISPGGGSSSDHSGRCAPRSAVSSTRATAVARFTTELGSIRRCQRTVQLDGDHGACEERATVVVRDAAGAEQALCLPRSATAIRRTRNLAVVRASRPDRAPLGEVAGEGCVVRRHVGSLLDAQGGSRGG